MSADTSIQWTDKTWNPIRGCSVVSPGCVNCYAMKLAHRFSGPGKPYEGLTKQTKAGPQWTGKVVPVESSLLEPLSWKKPQKVFVNSMSDLFHEDVPFNFIDRVFAVMALAQRHTFQILTKRADRMLAYLSRTDGSDVEMSIGGKVFKFQTEAERCVTARMHEGDWLPRSGSSYPRWPDVWPLPNVWLGVSCEDQKRADERIPLLLETPAAVRFVSAEPLLGPIDFTLYGHRIAGWDEDWRYNALSGEEWAGPRDERAERSQHLDWVICGGESGPCARPFDLAWARSIVSQCKAAGVACFVKQLGAKPYDNENLWARCAACGWIGLNAELPRDSEHRCGADKCPNCADENCICCCYASYEEAESGGRATGRDGIVLRDRKGGDPSEWPADLRVREFPESPHV